jgi:hypothetical protein
MSRSILSSLFLLFLASAAAAQTTPDPNTPLPMEPATIKLSGPRIGATFLSGGVVDKLRDDAGIDVNPAITQFGWQFEKRFYSGNNGLTAVSEWVVLAGGLDQGVWLPSVSWLVGLRTGSGIEFAAGPNVTPAGTAIAVAAGVTLRSGRLNFPLNVAIVPSQSGVRVSVLAGYNARK